MIKLDNLTHQYGKKIALNGISFEIPKGTICGYLGPNGAGKTTTVKILAGILPPTSGSAIISGVDIVKNSFEAKKQVGYVPESGALYESLTPYEYLKTVGLLHHMHQETIDLRIQEYMSFFKLSDQLHQSMLEFSKGMKQKVVIISALLHHPEVLILDEPLNGLDVQAVNHFKALLKQWSKEGKTIFYSSHLLEIVETLCDYVVILDQGHLVAQGSIKELKNFTKKSDLQSLFNQLVEGDDSDLKAQELTKRLNT